MIHVCYNIIGGGGGMYSCMLVVHGSARITMCYQFQNKEVRFLSCMMVSLFIVISRLVAGGGGGGGGTI